VILRARRRSVASLLALSLAIAACGTSTPTPAGSGSAGASPSGPVVPTPSASAQPGQVVPAPGSESTIYEPNPGEIVVAIDPGHGGCLDWGVPDPAQRGVRFSEKAMTLGIGRELRDLLRAQGISVVMTRDRDQALAGDDYPPLDCHGPAFRDVNGDGESGFHRNDPEGAVRTRDELQARLDLANVARADVLVSIHINSLTQDGIVIRAAATETFYTDETRWGTTATERLARLVQEHLVAALDPIARYQREDRGIKAHNLYIVAPPLLRETPERPDKRKQPTRGALMPSVLTEVGSITLAAEQQLLASRRGQAAAAQGIANALAAYFGQRRLAVRYAPDLAGDSGGRQPTAVEGDGPPFWIGEVLADELAAGFGLRLTNTGSEPWPSGLSLLAGWVATDGPYLRIPPEELIPLDVEIPTLGPGESVVVAARLSAPHSGGRQVAWVTLANGRTTLADLGSPPLQLATGEP
jgi:N-acetylmuramoyl-L-alanine amidase